MALTEVKKEVKLFILICKQDYKDLENLKTLCKKQFNDNHDLKKEWGGGKLGIKSQHKIEKQKKAVEAELAQKAQA